MLLRGVMTHARVLLGINWCDLIHRVSISLVSLSEAKTAEKAAGVECIKCWDQSHGRIVLNSNFSLILAKQ